MILVFVAPPFADFQDQSGYISSTSIFHSNHDILIYRVFIGDPHLLLTLYLLLSNKVSSNLLIQMIKDSMRSADLCFLTASNPDRIKDLYLGINAFPIMNLITVYIRKWKEESSLTSDDGYAGSTPQHRLLWRVVTTTSAIVSNRMFLI